MTIKTIIFSVAACMLVAGCASTDGGQATAVADEGQSIQTAEPSQAAADKRTVVNVVGDDGRDPDAMRCKRIAKTGSRVKKKVCATNREWDISEQRAKEMTEDYKRHSSYGREIDNRT